MDPSKQTTSAAINGLKAPVSRRALAMRMLVRIIACGFTLAEAALEKFLDLFIRAMMVITFPIAMIFVAFIETLMCPVRAEFRQPAKAPEPARHWEGNPRRCPPP